MRHCPTARGPAAPGMRYGLVFESVPVRTHRPLLKISVVQAAHGAPWSRKIVEPWRVAFRPRLALAKPAPPVAGCPVSESFIFMVRGDASRHGADCPQDLLPRSHRQPPQIACLPEGRAPRNRGLPSPHPSDPLRHTPKPVWRFFGSWIRTVRPGLAPSEHVAAIALRDALPEVPATAAKILIAVKFIRTRLELSGAERTSLYAVNTTSPRHTARCF